MRDTIISHPAWSAWSRTGCPDEPCRPVPRRLPGLEPLCEVGKNAKELKVKLKQLINLDFDEAELAKRVELLEPFGNDYNAKKLIAILESVPELSPTL